MDHPKLHPLRLAEIGGIDAARSISVETLACRECLHLFQFNAQAVVAVAQAPAFSAIAAVHWITSCTNAMTERGHGNSDEIIALKPEDFHNFFGLAQDKMAKALVSLSKDEPDHMKKAYFNLEQIIMGSGPGVHEIFHRHLKSIVVQAWTAVEVLIEELHSKAIQKHSRAFRPDVIDKEKLSHITHKGTFQFRSPRRMEESYDEAFSSDATIREALLHKDILALLYLRNAVVHSEGRADRKFIDLDLVACPALGIFNPTKGQKLKFDGCHVRLIVDSAYESVYKLIAAVDEWLVLKLNEWGHCSGIK